jgi:hypothetical protein
MGSVATHQARQRAALAPVPPLPHKTNPGWTQGGVGTTALSRLERWTWSVGELKAHTDAHNPWIIEHAYHGTDSAVRCLGNSDYTGTWKIARVDHAG